MAIHGEFSTPDFSALDYEGVRNKVIDSLRKIDDLEAPASIPEQNAVFNTIAKLARQTKDLFKKAEITPEEWDDTDAKDTLTEIRRRLRAKDSDFGAATSQHLLDYFNGFLTLSRVFDGFDNRSELQTEIASNARDVMQAAKNSLTAGGEWNEADDQFARAIKEAEDKGLFESFGGSSNLELQKKWDVKTATAVGAPVAFHRLGELVADSTGIIDWSVLKDLKNDLGTPLATPSGQAVQIKLGFPPDDLKDLLISAADSVDWGASQRGHEDQLTDDVVETLEEILRHVESELKNYKFDNYSNIRKELWDLREVIYRILHENRVIAAKAREGSPFRGEYRKYLRPSTKEIDGQVYGEMMMFLGEFYGDIDQAEAAGVVIARALRTGDDPSEKIGKQDKQDLVKLLQELKVRQLRYVLMLDTDEGVMTRSEEEKMDLLIGEIDKYIDWVDLLVDAVGEAEDEDETVPDEGLEAIVTFVAFDRLSVDKKFEWVEMALGKILNGGEISNSEANTGVVKYGNHMKGVFSEALGKMREIGGRHEKLANSAVSRILLKDIDLIAGVGCYCISYDALKEGGSLGDTSARWPGLGVPSVTFTIENLKFLLSQDHEVAVGDAEKLDLLIEVADSWFADEALKAEYATHPLSGEIRTIYVDAVASLSDDDRPQRFKALAKFEKKGDRLNKFDGALLDVARLIDAEHLFGTAQDLITFLDIRGARAQEQYAAADSPLDSAIKKTISVSTKRVNPQAISSYGILGKNLGGKFNPALALGRLSDVAQARAEETEEYEVGLKHEYRVVDVWLDWYAPIPDEFIDSRDDYEFYEGRLRFNPFPRIAEYYWHDRHNRAKWLAGQDVESFANFLENAINFETYTDACITGHKPAAEDINEAAFKDKTGKQREDAEHEEKMKATRKNAQKAISELSKKFSGAKGMILVENGATEHGMDGFYLARGMYVYVRQMVLSFGEQYWFELDNPSDYDFEIGRMCAAVWSAIQAAPTLKTIRFFSPTEGRVVSVAEYLKVRIPNPVETPGFPKPKMDWNAQPDILPGYAEAIYYDFDRVKNNIEHFQDVGGHLETIPERYRSAVRKVRGLTEHSHYIEEIPDRDLGLDKNGQPITSESLWRTTDLPPEVVGEKGKAAQAVEES